MSTHVRVVHARHCFSAAGLSFWQADIDIGELNSPKPRLCALQSPGVGLAAWRRSAFDPQILAEHFMIAAWAVHLELCNAQTAIYSALILRLFQRSPGPTRACLEPKRSRRFLLLPRSLQSNLVKTMPTFISMMIVLPRYRTYRGNGCIPLV